MPIAINLISWKILRFDDMTPGQTVVSAYESSRQNNNRWSYPTPENHPLFMTGKWFCACGNWTSPLNVELIIPAEFYEFGVPDSVQLGGPDTDGLTKTAPAWLLYLTSNISDEMYNHIYLLDDEILNAQDKQTTGPGRITPVGRLLVVTSVNIQERKFTVRIRETAWSNFAIPITFTSPKKMKVE